MQALKRAPLHALMGLLILALVLPLPQAQAALGDREAHALFQQYQRESLNLSPLAQIEAWLGFLKLHPTSPERDTVLLKVRMLAATLSDQEEGQLLAILAFQQLPDQLLGLKEPGLRLLAADDFARNHPQLFALGPRKDAYLALLERLDEPDPQARLARVLSGAPGEGTPGELRTAQPASTPKELPPSAPLAAPSLGATQGEAPLLGKPSAALEGSSLFAEAPAPAETGDLAASGQLPVSAGEPTSGAQPPAPVGGESEQPGAATNPVADSTGTDEPALARLTVPAQESLAEQASPSTRSSRDPEQERYRRWKEATLTSPPQGAQQLWVTYLLLYPDSAHRAEILADMEKLQGQVNNLSAENQALRQEVERLKSEGVKKPDAPSNQAFWIALGCGCLAILTAVLVSVSAL